MMPGGPRQSEGVGRRRRFMRRSAKTTAQGSGLWGSAWTRATSRARCTRWAGRKPPPRPSPSRHMLGGPLGRARRRRRATGAPFPCASRQVSRPAPRACGENRRVSVVLLL